MNIARRLGASMSLSVVWLLVVCAFLFCARSAYATPCDELVECAQYRELAQLQRTRIVQLKSENAMLEQAWTAALEDGQQLSGIVAQALDVGDRIDALANRSIEEATAQLRERRRKRIRNSIIGAASAAAGVYLLTR